MHHKIATLGNVEHVCKTWTLCEFILWVGESRYSLYDCLSACLIFLKRALLEPLNAFPVIFRLLSSMWYLLLASYLWLGASDHFCGIWKVISCRRRHFIHKQERVLKLGFNALSSASARVCDVCACASKWPLKWRREFVFIIFPA